MSLDVALLMDAANGPAALSLGRHGKKVALNSSVQASNASDGRSVSVDQLWTLPKSASRNGFRGGMGKLLRWRISGHDHGTHLIVHLKQG
jgi:hypothetical protein